VLKQKSRIYLCLNFRYFVSYPLVAFGHYAYVVVNTIQLKRHTTFLYYINLIEDYFKSAVSVFHELSTPKLKLILYSLLCVSLKKSLLIFAYF